MGTKHHKQLNSQGTDVTFVNGIYWEVDSEMEEEITKSGTYEMLHSFQFPGKDSNFGIQTSKSIISAKVNGQTGNVRIQDITNAQTICEETGITSGSFTEFNPTVSNLPAGPATFEVQALNTDDNKKKTTVNLAKLEFNGG